MRLTGAFRSIKTSQAAIKKRFSFIRHLERAFFSVSRSPKRREEDFFMAAERFSVKCMMHDHSQVSGQTSLQTGEEGEKNQNTKNARISGATFSALMMFLVYEAPERDEFTCVVFALLWPFCRLLISHLHSWAAEEYHLRLDNLNSSNRQRA
jgi:hypothetical protein